MRKCEWCTTFVHKRSLKRHKESCRGNKDKVELLCGFCGVIFVSKELIRRHTIVCKKDFKIRELEATVASMQQQLVAKDTIITTLQGELQMQSLDWDPATLLDA